MPTHWLRDSFFGQVLRLITKPSWLSYPEEHDFCHEKDQLDATPLDHETTVRVKWYTSTDEENPHNWTQTKKAFVLGVIGAYSFVVYMSAPIYTPSEDAFVEEFHVNNAEASLGLALYV